MAQVEVGVKGSGMVVEGEAAVMAVVAQVTGKGGAWSAERAQVVAGVLVAEGKVAVGKGKRDAEVARIGKRNAEMARVGKRNAGMAQVEAGEAEVMKEAVDVEAYVS